MGQFCSVIPPRLPSTGRIVVIKFCFINLFGAQKWSVFRSLSNTVPDNYHTEINETKILHNKLWQRRNHKQYSNFSSLTCSFTFTKEKVQNLQEFFLVDYIRRGNFSLLNSYLTSCSLQINSLKKMYLTNFFSFFSIIFPTSINMQQFADSLMRDKGHTGYLPKK